MYFVAFDLESTDGCFASGNICEFGYCIGDENFNVIAQGNILIRPLNKINTAYYRVKLSYPLSLYYSSPTFIENYEKIKEILSTPDAVVLGHAIHNDIVGINSACKNNTLKCIDFSFVDTQMLFSIYKKIPNILGLDKIAEEIGENFAHHRADEDARMSLYTLKYICQQEKLSFNELMAVYDATIGVNENGQITNFVSKNCLSQAPSINSKNSKRRILSMFEPPKVDLNTVDKNNIFFQKRVFINRDVMIEDIDLTRAMLTKLYKLGGRLSQGAMQAHFYVGDMENLEKFKGKVLSLQEFINYLGELEIKKYDDQAILDEYARKKEQERKIERISKINQTNKKLSKNTNKQ